MLLIIIDTCSELISLNPAPSTTRMLNDAKRYADQNNSFLWWAINDHLSTSNPIICGFPKWAYRHCRGIIKNKRD